MSRDGEEEALRGEAWKRAGESGVLSVAGRGFVPVGVGGNFLLSASKGKTLMQICFQSPITGSIYQVKPPGYNSLLE